LLSTVKRKTETTAQMAWFHDGIEFSLIGYIVSVFFASFPLLLMSK